MSEQQNDVLGHVSKAYAEQLKLAHGTGHYDECWKDHYPCVVEKLLTEIGRLTAENAELRQEIGDLHRQNV